MKTIGLLGGMSWQSTLLYYRLINEQIEQELGGLHSARIVMVSVDFQEIETLQHKGQWDEAGRLLAVAAQQIEAGGADFLLICTNTMHKVADTVQAAVSIPLLHLADSTAQEITDAGYKTTGLLGTRFTMEQDFYKGRLQEHHELNVIVPDEDDMQHIHRIIYEELCHGIVKDESRQTYLRVMDEMCDRGAQCIIQGCTEIVMLIQQQHCTTPLFDTTAIHARAAVQRALA